MGSAFNQQWTVEKFKNQDIHYQICLNLFMSPNQFFFITAGHMIYLPQMNPLIQSKCCNEDWKHCFVSCKTHQEHCTQSWKNTLRGSDKTDLGASLPEHRQSRACKQKDIQDLFDFLGQELHWCWQELGLRKAS